MAATQQQIDEIWKIVRETSIQMKETDKRQKETDRLQKETDKKIKELSNLFTTQWGKLVEALVEPGVLKLFKDRGVRVRETYRRAESERNGGKMEIDLLLKNSTEIVIIEVKTTLSAQDVQDFLDDLAHFLDFFPSYKDHKIYGAVAAISIDEGVDKFAYRNGLFVLKAGKEGIISILNDDKFKPKNFNFN